MRGKKEKSSRGRGSQKKKKKQKSLGDEKSTTHSRAPIFWDFKGLIKIDGGDCFMKNVWFRSNLLKLR